MAASLPSILSLLPKTPGSDAAPLPVPTLASLYSPPSVSPSFADLQSPTAGAAPVRTFANSNAAAAPAQTAAPAPAPGSTIPPAAVPAAVQAFRDKAGAAAPNMIQGGIPGSKGSGDFSGMTYRQLGAIAPLIPPVRSATERAGHELMDSYQLQHQANIEEALKLTNPELLAAQASGNKAAIEAAQTKQRAALQAEIQKHILNLKTINLPTYGSTEALQAAAQDH
jgi:hypothetical protein